MPHPNRLTRSAVCIALTILLASCSKTQEASAPAAPAEAALSNQPMGVANSADMARRVDIKESAPPSPPSAAPMADAAKPQASVTMATPVQQMASSSATFDDGQRKFIRTANARFLVKDVYIAALGVEDTVASHGGFVVKNDIGAVNGTSQSHPIGDGKLLELTEYTVQGQLTVRVPSAKTQDFLRAIATHIVFLDQRSFAAHDAQFEMLRQQLEMTRDQETQLELGRAVQEGGRLGARTEAINSRNEVKAARDAALVARKEFDDQVAFSTIVLNLYQPSRVLRSEKIDVTSIYREHREGFVSRLATRLEGGWDGLQNTALALAGIWPALVIAAAIAALAWRTRAWRRLAARA